MTGGVDAQGDPGSTQRTPFNDLEADRAILGQLLERTRLYRSSRDYQELLDFTCRLRNFAPYNAMLLQIQKPGLTFAASAYDWWHRFGRRPKEDARPLIILWPFGPFALVYAILDTEGRDLPRDAMAFYARGKVNEARMHRFRCLLSRKNIECVCVDEGDARAGAIAVTGTVRDAKGGILKHYGMKINRNHPPATQFATLAHELGHLFLGHLGPDKALRVPERPTSNPMQRELEAESVSYMVCRRSGVKSSSERYLASFVRDHDTIARVDVYQVMKAAGQVEALLELGVNTGFGPRKKEDRSRKPVA
ncbi:MAG: ImmA/IrrE family metallo-endopeptidase [Candidatus Brocadiia bacterium]